MSRLLIEVVLGITLITATVFYLEHRGAQKCIAADKEAEHKQEVHNAETHGEQVVEVKHEAEDFKRATETPITDAPRVRLCPRPSAVPVARTPGPVDHEETEHRDANQGVPAAIEWDSTGVVQAGRDADAQITQLEAYIDNVCQKR